MSSPWDFDDILSMVDEADQQDEEVEKPKPSPRFTHRVVPLEDDFAFGNTSLDEYKITRAHRRLTEIQKDARLCACHAGLLNLVIEIDNEEVTPFFNDCGEAQVMREAMREKDPFHRTLKDGDELTANSDIQLFFEQISREAVSSARRMAERDYNEKNQSPAIARLDKEMQGPVRSLTKFAPMAGPQNAHEVDVLAAELHASAPWLRDATTHIWKSMLENLEGGHGPCIRPILIYGPPGSGKTSLARTLAKAMGTAHAEIDVGAGSAGFRIAGTEKGWSSANTGVPVQTALDTGCPNPVMVVNELCEAGAGMRSTGGNATSIVTALMQLLDVESAARFTCPALRVPFDMSRVSWVLTANDLDKIPAHLLSRVRRVYAPMPSASDVADIVRNRLDGLEPDLVDHAAGLVADKWKVKSGAGSMTLRQVEALCERLRRAATGPVLH